MSLIGYSGIHKVVLLLAFVALFPSLCKAQHEDARGAERRTASAPAVDSPSKVPSVHQSEDESVGEADAGGIASRILRSPFVGLFGLAAALISIIVTVILARKYRKIKRPTYVVNGNNLLRDLSSSFSKLEVSYDGTKVQTVTVSTLTFWNAGSETMRREDIANKDKLRIILDDDVDLLDARVVHQTTEANQFEIHRNEAEPNTVFITFDYLDRDEGGVIQLVHTGRYFGSPCVLGRIMGAGKPTRRGVTPTIAPFLFPRLSRQKRRIFFRRLMQVYFLLTIAAATLIFVIFLVKGENPLATYLASGLLLCFALFIYYSSLRRNVPKSLDLRGSDLEESNLGTRKESDGSSDEESSIS